MSDSINEQRRNVDPDEHFPWHQTEFGVVCACGLPMDKDETCEAMRVTAAAKVDPSGLVGGLNPSTEATSVYAEIGEQRLAQWAQAAKTTAPNPFEHRQEHAGCWTPGDPCASCGSRDTGWTAALGGHCRACGKADSDE